MSDKQIILIARFFSALFRPFYMPLISFLALFMFTYLNVLPFSYKLSVLALVYCLTILLPQLLIFAYRSMKGWQAVHLRRREHRVVPYILSILSYLTCLYVMGELRMPRYMGGIIVSALLIQISCAVVNIWWKVSTHSAAMGGLIGGLLAFSLLFMFNPVYWLCVAVLLAGVVGSCRMLLRQHSLGQVLVGTLIGIVFGFWGILMPFPSIFH